MTCRSCQELQQDWAARTHLCSDTGKEETSWKCQRGEIAQTSKVWFSSCGKSHSLYPVWSERELEREWRLQESEEATKWHRQCKSKPLSSGAFVIHIIMNSSSCITLSWIYRLREWSAGEETTQAINNWREEQQEISRLCWFNKKAWNSSLSLFKQLLKIELLKVRIFKYYCRQDMLTALILSFSPYKV